MRKIYCFAQNFYSMLGLKGSRYKFSRFSIVCIAWSLFFQSGCSWNPSHRPSVLVIAVDSLSVNDLPCGPLEDNVPYKGFKTFCTDAVRFTHAFAPSTLSQSSLASLLTGMYPIEHHVLHNGGVFIPATIKTVAEAALEQGYSTAFFSGGPPIFRKAAINQGFEVFNDRYLLAPKKLYRPAKETIGLWLDWLNLRGRSQPTFSFLFLPDLQFPDVTTKTDLGEIRDQSRQSQLLELNESIEFLIRSMQRNDSWDETYVILVGLNGYFKDQNSNPIKSLDLSSKSTQVSFFIKPAQKKRDLGVNWKIDKNVSLVDLGATLYDIIGADIPIPESRMLNVVSLVDVTQRPEATWQADRLILLESGWPYWRGTGNSRYAIRKGQFLIKYDSPIKIYDTLIDRNELYPINTDEALYEKLSLEANHFFKNRNIEQWISHSDDLPEKVNLAKKIFLNKKQYHENISQLISLSNHRFWDIQIIHWQANLALQQKDWAFLDKLGKTHKYPLWQYVAKINQDKLASVPTVNCGTLFNQQGSKFHRPGYKSCSDELLIKAVDWTSTRDRQDRAQKLEAFWRPYHYIKLDREIGKYNFINGLEWDTNLKEPSEPLLADLYLSLPQNKSFKKIIDKRLKKYSK